MCKCNKIVLPTPQNAIKGAVAIAKSMAGIGMADSFTRSKRLEICQKCPENAGFQCQKCGCLINQKIKRKEEKCPLNNW